MFLRYNTAVLTISVVSPPVDHTQLHFLRLPAVVVNDFTLSLSSLTSSPSSPSRRPGRLRLHLRLVVLVVFAFISVSSSWSSSPSSPSRRLGRLRLHLRLVVSSSSPSSPSLSTPSPRRRLFLHPSRREFTVDRRSGIVLFCIVMFKLTRWLPPRLRPIFFVACRDRPQWPSPQGALGNAPVGTSLCRCRGGFLRVCIPCNGFRHRVSPDLSSDKSHLVRDP
ncbi:hypothetical protein OUZ56_004479 [Daphnia magna]|uniref:Uncharacterized protein n=1 Tax=Daphnia magna TaxID=35525 RepID=A0ABQ9YQ03_9CRUS|nr:hypothetical protein OUZ56_004479 [Daphnia magna]